MVLNYRGGVAVRNINDIDLKQVIEDLTGERFNREKKIHSPFKQENTPSFTIYFDSNSNKYKFKDFSTGKQGDGLDFVMQYKNCSYKEARSYLGLEVEKAENELWEDKIRSYIDWQLQDIRRGYTLLGIFTFVDENNKPIYAKAKFLKPDGKKETPYYCIENGKVTNKRGTNEVPYNYYNLLKGIAEDKTIIFVEGEKDANTINNILKNKTFVASSLKGVKNFEKLKSNEFMKIYVIGDTGEAGQRYIQDIKKEFFDKCSKFKIINLPGIKSLGDNKDVTDWLEAGHNKNDLFNAFDRSLDLRDKSQLQQDYGGVYKFQYDKSGENPRKVYITDFQILEAKTLINVEADFEDIALTVKSRIDGKIYPKTDSSTVLNDLRSFRNFLGAKLNFKGEKKDLNTFREWLSNYFFLEDEEVYQGVRFSCINGKMALTCADGTIFIDGIDTSAFADGTKIKLTEVEKIETSELLELKKRLFRFLSAEKSISIVGTIINNLAVYQNMAIDEKLHHLFITGESESGKSTILERIIAPILNYPAKEKISVSSAKPFGFSGSLCLGNYPLICDEFKPSKWNQYKTDEVCNTMRDAYDRTPMPRGDKSFKIKNFIPERPIIMAGEESYPDQETALITRSCIVYISKNERTEENSTATFWLIEHKDILNKFGRSLIDEVLNMSVEQYKDIRKSLGTKFDILKGRAFDTALNIACGIEILNILLERHGLNIIENYEQHIIKNIQDEVLDGGKEAKSTVEQMLILYSQMIEDKNTCVQETIIQDRKEDGFYIRTTQLLNEIFRFQKEYGSADIKPLKLKDFRKQAIKAGYILIKNAKQLRIGTDNPVWYDLYDKEKLKELNVTRIVEPDLIEEAVTKAEQKFLDSAFPKK